MSNPEDVSVAICTHMSGIARTLRMALRGMGVRYVALANDTAQLVDGFAASRCKVLDKGQGHGGGVRVGDLFYSDRL